MKIMVRDILYWSVVVAILATILVSIFFYEYGFYDDPNIQRQYFELFGSIYKAIGIGFIVAIFSAVIPQLLPETKYNFEKYKDSRIAYSEAKTGIIYLPYKLSVLPYEKAISLIQEVHEKLHVAESYDEIKYHLAPYNDPDTWGERKYKELMAMKKVLGRHIHDWKGIKKNARLNEFLEEIDKIA